MIGGLLAGALSLIALQVFTSGNGAERGGALLQWVAGGVQQIISPDRAGIPNLSGPKTPPPAGGGGAGSGSQPAPGHSSVGGPSVPVSLPTNPIFKTL